MLQAWTPRRSHPKVGPRKVKAGPPRCLPRLERCEERLPPGQLVDFFFDPVGDVLPLFLNAADRDQIRNATPALRDSQLSWLTPAAATQTVADRTEPADFHLLDPAARVRTVAVTPADVDQAMTVWTGQEVASLDFIAADLLVSPFTTDETPVHESAADLSSAGLLPEQVAGTSGGRFVSPSDVSQRLAPAVSEPHTGVDGAGSLSAQLVNLAGMTSSTTVTLTGRLQVLTASAEDRHFPDQYELQMGEQSMPLLVDAPLTDLQTGDTLTVRGELTAEGLLTSRGQITLVEQAPEQSEDASAGPGLTYRTVLVINVNFTDRVQQPWTIASVENLFDNTIAPWYLDGSYGRMMTYTDAAGWYTINSTSTSCSTNTWNTLGRQAASAQGYAVSAYNHVVIAFPRVPACSWSGLGQMPGTTTWLNQAMNHGVAVHELGHNLGLGHSHSRRCSTGPLTGTCTTSEYGDPFDVMGNAGGRAHYHASYRSHTGWIPAGDRLSVTPAMGEAYLGIYSAGAWSGPRMIQVRRGNGRTDSLYLEWREAVGWDYVLASNPSLLNGVTIYLGSSLRDQSIVDYNYQTSTASDAAMPVGEVFYDYDGGVAIWPYDRSDGVTSFYIAYF